VTARTLPSPPLLVISDRTACRGDVVDALTAAFHGGARWALLSEKDLPPDVVRELARRLVAAAEPFGAMVLVSGEAEIAREVGADGVHLPQGRSVALAREVLGPDGLIGVSAHSPAEARAAAAAGADYATLSPIFLTGSKPGYGPALGLAELARTAQAVALPLVALAGVDVGNARACLEAGAAAIAVMGGIMRAADPAAATAALVAALRTGAASS
jgi:thiamine-phosphate pyrophosphorylase